MCVLGGVQTIGVAHVSLLLYINNYDLSTGQTDRPKSHCEQHRDSLQSGLEQGGRPSVGAFVPQCDSDGQYRPLQVGTDWPSGSNHCRPETLRKGMPRISRCQ